MAVFSIIIRHWYCATVENLVVGLVCLSTWTHISVSPGWNFLILGMMMSYDLGNDVCSLKMFILSGISDTDKNVLVSKKGYHTIWIGNSQHRSKYNVHLVQYSFHPCSPIT